MKKAISQFSCFIILLLVTVAFVHPGLSQPNQSQASRSSCVNDLKMIDLALRVWEGSHNDDFPWNVSTNAGGVKEVIGLDDNNFVTNSWRVFQVISNELSDSIVLICPDATNKMAAANFSHLTSSNVTYRIHVIPTLTPSQSMDLKSPLVFCPIDGNILYYNESIKIRKP